VVGFTPEATTIKLNFEGTALQGLEVVTNSITVGKYNALISSAGNKSLLESNAIVLDEFLAALVSWNLEIPAGRPVPRTRKGCERIDSPVMTEILAAWMVALTSVPTKSPTQSRNGDRPSRSEESNLGLAGLSENPGS
jgi:hypothetical protein